MADVLHTLDFRLAYSECDPAGIVYYGSYHPWMERIHTYWTFEHGIRPDRAAERWGASPVARHAEVDYLRPAYVFDPVRAEMRLDGIGRSSYTLRTDFTHAEDGGMFAVGRMTLVFVAPDGKTAPVPDEMREHLLSAGAP